MKKLLLAFVLAPCLSFGQFQSKKSILDQKTVTLKDTTITTIKGKPQPLNWPIAKTVRVSGSFFAAGGVIMAIGKLISNQTPKTKEEIKRNSDIGVYSTVLGSALIVVGGGLMASQR